MFRVLFYCSPLSYYGIGTHPSDMNCTFTELCFFSPFTHPQWSTSARCLRSSRSRPWWPTCSGTAFAHSPPATAAATTLGHPSTAAHCPRPKTGRSSAWRCASSAETSPCLIWRTGLLSCWGWNSWGWGRVGASVWEMGLCVSLLFIRLECLFLLNITGKTTKTSSEHVDLKQED